MTTSTSKATLGWGIIGCGDVVERKGGTAYHEVPASRLVAVMRRSADKVEAYAKAHGVPRWTTDPQQIIDDPAVDLVYIATPPANHLEYALQVAAAGKPCLVEKPVGRSALETGAMVAAFAESRQPLFASYYRRYLPKFLKVKAILESGQLGPIVSVHYRYSRTPLANDWRVSPEQAGGGRFYDLGCHVLDLLDDWFGPLIFSGGAAVNSSPSHSAEDAISLSFRTPGGAVGCGLWNFTAHRGAELLEIEGLWGKLSLACLDCWSPLTLELDSDKILEGKCLPPLQRRLRRLRGKKPCPKRVTRVHEFEPMKFPHRPMIEAIVAKLRSGNPGPGNGEAALRTAKLMDRVLDDYYGGRDNGFLRRPQSWRSLRASACRRATEEARAGLYKLSEQQLREFAERGYLGPFQSESKEWRRLHIPEGERVNLHLQDPQIFALCSQPAVVVRVAQLLGNQGVSLMKSRVWVKAKSSTTLVPWHQDVALNNGGLREDGSPVPTVTVWLSIDGANREKGAVELLPGSHRQLIGDWKMGLQAWLEDNGVLREEHLNDSVRLDAKPGEFYLFHSWVLHGSGPNSSNSKRTGLNMRFAARGDEYEPQFEYIPLGGGTVTCDDDTGGLEALRELG
jgi:predicted dehydrogenase